MVEELSKNKLEDYKQSNPQQMELFALVKPENKPYSHTIELYDAIPKYYYGNRPKRIQGQFLLALDRKFKHRGKDYRVLISPARIIRTDKEGNVKDEKDYYPGKREELVEEALRKIATQNKGVYLVSADFLSCE